MVKHDEKENKGDKKKVSKTKKIVGVILVLILVIVAAGVGAYNYLDDSNFVELKGGKEELNISKETEEKSKKNNVENILLLGVDKQENATDTMMILSLDKNNNKIKITSLLRDMYVNQGEGKANKINYAYHYGGVEGSVATVNELFDLDIQKYVKVTFEELISIVDLIGGIELDITKKEQEVLNLKSSGRNQLNGSQTLAYSRIRSIDSDMKRSERQRNVMLAIFNKSKATAKEASNLPQLIKSISSTIETNINIGDLVKIGTYILGMSVNDLEELRLPLDGTTSHFTSGVYHLNWEKEPNLKALQTFIYGE